MTTYVSFDVVVATAQHFLSLMRFALSEFASTKHIGFKIGLCIFVLESYLIYVIC